MEKILHIVASPRGARSRTLKISDVFLRAIKNKYPDCKVDTLNLFEEDLPRLTLKRLDGKYALLGGGELSGELKSAWKDIERQIERFKSAGGYIVSAPMWNFSIPYPLKHYIDVILQPKYLFRYTEKGPEGLVKNRKMVIITTRGGDYSEKSAYDHQEPYLRAVFGFVGITDIIFINAQPMDALGPATAKAKLDEAKAKAKKTAENF